MSFIRATGVVAAVFIVPFLAITAFSDEPLTVSGGAIKNGQCIDPAEYEQAASLPRPRPSDKSATSPQITTLFAEPIDGGINGPGRFVTNYVDLDANAGILDYSCRDVTYEGHRGIDIVIRDFYDMDEGVPILCAADGVVLDTEDGHADRWLTQTGAPANYVIVSHPDGTEGWYWHMRRNSVRVSVGDAVQVGDTLGLVGSSGNSDYPHLHFEVRDGGSWLEPFNGSCQPSATRWDFPQPDHTLDLPVEVLAGGMTTISSPPTWQLVSERPPSEVTVHPNQVVNYWIKLRSLKAGDVLDFKIYNNGSYYNHGVITASQNFTLSWWYISWVLPPNPPWYGTWRVDVWLNGATLIASQPFTFNNEPDVAPVMTDENFAINVDDTLDGEFNGTDADGAIFWYDLVTPPTNGTVVLDGGRRRKYSYVPTAGWTGTDQFQVRCVDEDSLIGNTATYTVDVIAGTATPVGTNVEVPLSDGWTLTFDNVTTEGNTSVAPSGCTPSLDGYKFVPTSATTCYEVTTSASYSGNVMLCYEYDPAGMVGPESNLEMFHYDGADWVDITSSIDEANNIICGQTTSLSPFVIAYRCCDQRGDLDNSGNVEVSDLTSLVAFLFSGGPAAECDVEGDFNGDGSIDVSDLTDFVAYLFSGGPGPAGC